MEITNKHRDVYKVLCSTIKKNKIFKVEENSDEFKLLKDLEIDGYVIFDGESFNINENNKLKKKEKEKAYKHIVCKDKNLRIDIKRCEKPKFGGRGRTWDNFPQLLNNIENNFYVDTTWGDYIYFSAPDERWYKISTRISEDDFYSTGFSNVHLYDFLTKEKLNLTLQY
jgi:hypothetical protein